ncbi:MAG: hypothetical protein MUC88_00545 [Planctomycetes bacterium]|nr:hypothetical protein [Planctomycetota bacterium]
MYPHSNDPVFTKRKSSSPRYLTWERDTSEGTVTQFTWSKRLGQPSGTWSAVVKLGKLSTLDAIGGDLVDGDWVDLFVLRNNLLMPLGRGVLDTVREGRSSAGGATVRTISLSGRDHGALFETMIAWNQMNVQSLREYTVGINTNAVKHNIGGRPDEMFKILTEATFHQGSSTTRSAWSLPPALKSLTGSSRFSEMLKINTKGPLRGALFNMNLWTQPGQSLHQLLGQWCNPLLNEWRYDAEPAGGRSKVDIYAEIRERPYVNTIAGRSSPWFDLPTLYVPTWLVTERDLGRAGHERFTIFDLSADFTFGTNAESTALAPPIWSKPDITNFGVKPYSESTIYIAQGAPGEWISDRKDWQRMLADWFGPNPYFLSGSVTFGCMLPELRIGTRLILDTGDPETSLQAYVEGVDHTFQWSSDGSSGPRTSTVATVTRGWKGDDASLLDMVERVSGRYQESW